MEDTKEAQSLAPGALLRMGSYRIDKILGQGGFGLTYLATDTALDKKVCIKEFFPKQYCGRQSDTRSVSVGTTSMSDFVDKLKSKFLKEARNIAKFNHPDIIRIHAAFEENNTAYYVMDYIDGQSLSEMVKERGPLPEAEALDYIRHIGSALDYVHSQHINHLDVKPANIMVRRSDNMPILIDFGLSKRYDSRGIETSTTPTGISHGYAPLEQYNKEGVKEFSPQTDLYSLAATLYYLLTGIVPPQAPTLINDKLDFPPGIPARLVAPLTKAMSPTRRDRHNTVAEFIGEIDCPEETNVNVEPAPSRQQPVKAKPANGGNGGSKGKIIGIVAALLVVAAIAVAAFLAGGNKPEPEETEEPTEKAVLQTASGISVSTPLGQCIYSGEVDADGLPHGHGEASWTSGVAKHYDGNWHHGHMDGQTTYTLSNGDTFEGLFKDDHYDEGTYTQKATGDYYIGTFTAEGTPDQGDWFDKRGKKY